VRGRGRGRGRLGLRMRLRRRLTVTHDAASIGEVLAAHGRRVGGAVVDAAVARHVRQARGLRGEEREGAGQREDVVAGGATRAWLGFGVGLGMRLGWGRGSGLGLGARLGRGLGLGWAWGWGKG